MKKALKIIGIIFLVIIIVLASLAIWQRDNIKSFYIAMKYDSEELKSKMDGSQETMQQNIEAYTGISFREPTEEEQKMLEQGKITKADLFEKILNETIEEYLKDTQDNEDASAPTEEVPQKNPSVSENEKPQETEKSQYDIIVAKYVSKLYALKGSYIGKLESLIGQADAEFHKLPKSEWTAANRSAMISKYISIAAGYESACDSEVNSLLSSLSSELKAIGADTSVVSVIRQTYAEEKSLKIAYYMSKAK